VFGSTTGAQNVTLTVGSKGCYASITKSAYITVKGPIAQLTTSTDCSSSRVYTFQAMVQDANHWTWDFGDGTTVANSTTTTISHTYSVSGNFVAKLTASNNTSGCAPSIDSAKVYVRKIKATLLSPDTLFCSGKSISFNASPSTDVDPQCNSGYYWIWGDDKGPGIYGSPTASHIYLKPGKYDLKLIVKDINNCWDTLVRPVRASGVTPKFVSNVKYGCLPLSVNFTDQSVSDTTIVAWSWNFGDGGNGTTQNPTHLFTATAPKTFTVTETVTNKLGCMAQYTSTITPSRPDTGFSASKTTLCTGDSVKFTPTTLNHKGYSWNFGDGTAVSTATSPYHVFKKPGAFAVSLEVSDSIGCKGTKTIVNYITVQGVPNVGFYSTADSVGAKNCYPLLVQFKDTSIANIFQSRIWDLGNGTQVVPNTQVGTTYQLPGTYTVSLSVTTTFGCSSKLTKSIKVNGPVGDFTLTPTTICKGSSVTLGVKDTARVFTYHWDFGDGYDAGKASPVTHVFNHHPVGGQAQITLVYWSADSSCKKAVTHNLKIHQVTAEFKRNGEAVKSDTVHCLGVQDVFTNNSQSASTWLWNFGDGNTSTVNNPTYTYTAAGTYSVSLNIKDNTLGCVDTLVKKMYINQLPVVSATGGEKCEDKLLQLSATGGVTYNWLPLKNLNSSNIPNPVVDTLLKVNTNYTVVATDANGCTGVGVAPVLINHRPKSIKWDTTIVIGQTIAIDTAYQGTNYTYVWSPADSLSCTTCGIPTIKPLVNKDFTVSISDKKGCFPSINSYIKIVVDPKSSLDVPTAFSPNGDGVNDVVYVDGWGIKKLLEFKIYNRWGELLFTSNDLKTGWDGKYNGVVQNIDSYAYTVIAETYVDKQPLTKKGYIKIIK
jgi:gliding motility-associated-like protein